MISEGSVFTIMTEHLSMRELFSKWMPRLLTVDRKQQRVADSDQCLAKAINSDYYTTLLHRLKVEIVKKRPHMAKKTISFHQDNAPCHKSIKTMVKLHELHFELLPHPPYSAGLAIR